MEALDKKFDRPGGAKYKFYADEKRFRFISFFFANDIYKLSERFIWIFLRAFAFWCEIIINTIYKGTCLQTKCSIFPLTCRWVPKNRQVFPTDRNRSQQFACSRSQPCAPFPYAFAYTKFFLPQQWVIFVVSKSCVASCPVQP
jgi:hypothetical protein